MVDLSSHSYPSRYQPSPYMVLLKIQGDILIDDKPLIKGKDEPRWFHVLFTAAHNTHVTEYHSNQMRLDTWDKEALDKLIEEIKQKKAAK